LFKNRIVIASLRFRPFRQDNRDWADYGLLTDTTALSASWGFDMGSILSSCLRVIFKLFTSRFQVVSGSFSSCKAMISKLISDSFQPGGPAVRCRAVSASDWLGRLGEGRFKLPHILSSLS